VPRVSQSVGHMPHQPGPTTISKSYLIVSLVSPQRLGTARTSSANQLREAGHRHTVESGVATREVWSLSQRVGKNESKTRSEFGCGLPQTDTLHLSCECAQHWSHNRLGVGSVCWCIDKSLKAIVVPDALVDRTPVTRCQLAPYPLTINHGVCSNVSPHHRSCFGRPKRFPSSDEHSHHQIDQIHIDGSRIGPRNPSAASRVLPSFLLFCHSSLSNGDGLWKASCGTPHLQLSVSPDPQWNWNLRLRPYMVRRILHALLLRCLAGAIEYLIHKTGHFACWRD
jgi:hypothetical protein